MCQPARPDAAVSEFFEIHDIHFSAVSRPLDKGIICFVEVSAQIFFLLRREFFKCGQKSVVFADSHAVKGDSERFEEVFRVEFADNDSDRAGYRIVVGKDPVGIHRNVVAARRRDASHRDDYRFCIDFLHRFDLIPDSFGGNHRAAG